MTYNKRDSDEILREFLEEYTGTDSYKDHLENIMYLERVDLKSMMEIYIEENTENHRYDDCKNQDEIDAVCKWVVKEEHYLGDFRSAVTSVLARIATSLLVVITQNDTFKGQWEGTSDWVQTADKWRQALGEEETHNKDLSVILDDVSEAHSLSRKARIYFEREQENSKSENKLYYSK